MLFGFINRVTPSAQLRGALDASVVRSRAIGDRVAKATMANGDGFALPATTGESAPGAVAGPPVDVEAEMVSLADEQIRYETTAKLLQTAYQQLRTAMKGTA